MDKQQTPRRDDFWGLIYRVNHLIVTNLPLLKKYMSHIADDGPVHLNKMCSGGHRTPFVNPELCAQFGRIIAIAGTRVE